MNVFYRLLRWLIFLRVKVDVFPDQESLAELIDDTPVLYVLADRGITDLLVLTDVCRKNKLNNPLDRINIKGLTNHHSVYGIASRNPLIDWLRNRPKQSALLEDFVQKFQSDPTLKLKVIPVSVYWGRPLARQKHWIQVLFSDTWAVGGRIRKFFTILIHGGNTRLLFSQSLDFRQLIETSNANAVEIHDSLLTQLTQQREATFGPQIKTHRVMSNEVLESPLIQSTINNLTETESQSPEKLKAQAKKYCDEIFANCTQLTIELMLRLLRQFWRRFYAGMDTYNIDPVKQLALTHQLVYVPCHRSHVDYLLLSYIIFTENLAIPYIAAGNNLDMPVIGRILRGGGAYFIRRSFKDNPLYSAVMRQYLQELVSLGVPLEYFIEGGRSRTGRLLNPKVGMLDMTLAAYIKSQKRPMAFVPVYIGYDKLIEGKSYLGELYGGKKKKESFVSAIAAIFKLSGNFGRVTTSFGEPIKIDDMLDEANQDWREAHSEIDARPKWYKKAVSRLSNKIMVSINRACIVNPVNIIALAILATPRQSIDIQDLVYQSQLISRLMTFGDESNSFTLIGDVNKQKIEEIADQGLIQIKKHDLGDIVHLDAESSVLMSYYRNNCLHAIVTPALLACCFVNNRKISKTKPARLLKILYPFLRSELQLEWDDKAFVSHLDQYIEQFVENGLLTRSGNYLQRPDRSDRQYLSLIRLAQIVQPILERYYMTFIVLWQSSNQPLTEPEIELRCHLLAQKISMIYGMNSPDFFDRALFRHFLETMIKMGYIEEDQDKCLVFTDQFDHISLDLRNLLSVEVRSSILSLISSGETTQDKNF